MARPPAGESDGMTAPLLAPPAVRASLPFPPAECGRIFAEALRALSMCADAATACGSSGARTYAAGAAGALRHALAILAAGGRVATSSATDGFETRRVGTSELIGSAVGWDAIARCELPDGSAGMVRAVFPAPDPARGIWMRSLDAAPGWAVRGSVERTPSGLRFVDRPTLDLPPAPPVRHDLGRDLVRAGLPDLSRTPALAAALEVALSTGSWLHLPSGTRWFTDPAGARAILRMLGSPVVLDHDAARRLAGMVDREALLLVERLGWRHLPTPRAC